MNQADLIAAVAEHSGNPLKAVSDVLGSLAEIAQGELKAGGEVVLPHLGKLKVKERLARAGRNPKTGEGITVPAKTVVVFKVAKDLRDAMPKPKAKK